MIEKYTNFEYGFNFKGKRNNDVGEDIVSVYKAPDGWTMPVYSGTPVNIDPNNEGDLMKTPDGEKPEYLLYTRVADELTDIEMYENVVMRDEIPKGNPVEVVAFRENAAISTKLFVDGYTPTAGDKLYVDSGKLNGSDPLSGEGVSIGKVKLVDGDYARVVLDVGYEGIDLPQKIEKINVTAPADGTEQDSGYTIPENAIVKDVKLMVNTAESTGTTATIDVGTDSTDSGDADGYLVGVDVSSTGLVKGTLDNGGQTLGDLLTVVSDATNSVKVPEDDIASGGKALTFTAGSADFAELDADIVISYVDLK